MLCSILDISVQYIINCPILIHFAHVGLHKNSLLDNHKLFEENYPNSVRISADFG